MDHRLGAAVEKLAMTADVGMAAFDRDLFMDQQWLTLQSYESIPGRNPLSRDPESLFQRPKPPKHRDAQPLDQFTTAEPSGSKIDCHPAVGQFPPSYSELILSGERMLNDIMGLLGPSTDQYRLSDWEHEDAMKPIDCDVDAFGEDGKQYPDWACGTKLSASLARQNPSDGDVLFQSLARRCNLIDLFGTDQFKYYQKPRRQ
jgi:hypothetical protein